MIRIRPVPDAVGLGPSLPTTITAFASGHLIFFYAGAFLTGCFPLNSRHAWLNLWLLLILGIVVAAWTLGYARRWITAATGAGIVVSAVALVGRTACELFLGFFHQPIADLVPGDPAVTLCALVRYGGLAVFAFGLACTGAACVAERRVRRTAPDWVIPP